MTTKVVIPNIEEIQNKTAVGAIESKNETLRWGREHEERQNFDCAQRIEKAASKGETSASCDGWIGKSFINSLRAGGYQVTFVDTLDDGEGGRLSSIDALYPPYFNVSWSPGIVKNK